MTNIDFEVGKLRTEYDLNMKHFANMINQINTRLDKLERVVPQGKPLPPGEIQK